MCNCVVSPDGSITFYLDLYLANTSIDFTFQTIDRPKLGKEKKQATDQPITMDELTNTLKHLKKNKTPGCDGVGPDVYLVLSHLTGITNLQCSF